MDLNGIITPLITPLSGRNSLDKKALYRLVEHIIKGGVNGVFVLGSTGEGPCLSYQLRRELVRETCRIVSSRIPVLVAISDTSMEESIDLAKVAAEAGADAVVLATPYYFSAGQTELLQYVRTIVSELPLPAMLYNMPALTKVWFEIETLRKLIDLEGIIGIKDSSGDLAYYEELCSLKNERPNWTFFIGPEEKMIASLALGGDGGVNGGANVYPKLFVDAYRSTRDGDEVRKLSLQRKIEAFGKIYEVGKYASRFMKGTKCAVSILGLCDDRMAEPFNRFYPEDREKVKKILDDLDLES